MSYRHTQHAPLYLFLLWIALGIIVADWLWTGTVHARPLVLVIALVLVALAFCCQTLTVRDEGTRLAVRYGPIPLFRRHILYDAITAVNRSRSSWIDGWGIHYVPGRGWTYNLWGFDCVELRLGERIVRVGTDDPDGLVRCLETMLHGRGENRSRNRG